MTTLFYAATPLSSTNHSKALVASDACHVVIIADTPLKGGARRLGGGWNESWWRQMWRSVDGTYFLGLAILLKCVAEKRGWESAASYRQEEWDISSTRITLVP
jgi:hypothetical protein